MEINDKQKSPANTGRSIQTQSKNNCKEELDGEEWEHRRVKTGG